MFRRKQRVFKLLWPVHDKPGYWRPHPLIEPEILFQPGKKTRMPPGILKLGYGFIVIPNFEVALVHYGWVARDYIFPKQWICDAGRLWRPRRMAAGGFRKYTVEEFQKLVAQQPDVLKAPWRSYCWRGGLVFAKPGARWPEVYWWDYGIWMTDWVRPVRQLSDAEVVGAICPEAVKQLGPKGEMKNG